MTTDTDFETPRAELEHLLDSWGGAPARWPPRVSARIAALTGAVPDSRAMLSQARALDRLLDKAGEAPARVSPTPATALADRILATAIAGQVPARTSTEQQRTNDNVFAFRPKAQPRSQPNQGWQTAGLIAACLMAGIYLGGSLNLTPMLQELAEVAGISTVIDPTIVAIGDDLSDEETL